jgi:hypothetical protein
VLRLPTGNRDPISGVMNLDLTDEETALKASTDNVRP